MIATAQSKAVRRLLWAVAYFMHATLVWIGRETLGDNYLWVMDPQHPWIKDRFVPPLSTLINLPLGLLCAGVVCLLAYGAGRLIGDRSFGIVRFLVFAFVITILLALRTGNFVVLTGPLGVRADNWYLRPPLERVVLSAIVTGVFVLIEGLVLWGVTALINLSAPRLPAAAS